ncbi:serine/threonine-protein kinase [Okibacterium endophyticum]
MRSRQVAAPPELPGLRYLRLLGSGGFSDVFLYEQELPRRQVAVKVLAADDLTDASRSGFVSEANLMAQLSAHPYIVTIYHAAFAPDGRPYFAMEYCAGPSLAEQYKSRRFGVADALRTGVRLSSAVATAHAAGILHRDIKPANVLTNAYGWPALTDFGISSAVDTEFPANTTTRAALDSADQATATGTIGMSIPWSAPELFDDHPNADVRSDVFSLAATVYTLLAGHTPFEIPGRPNGVVDLIGRIERGAITPIQRTDIPRSLTAVLHKGMSANRENRFSSAIDFARALQRVEMELSYAPTTIDVPNLTVHDIAGTEAADEAGDATRVRQMPSINAHYPATTPDEPPTASLAGGAGHGRDQQADPTGDDTVVRPPLPVQHGSTEGRPIDTVIRRPAAAVPPDDASAASEPGRRRWVPAVLGVAAGVAVAGVVTAAVVFGSSETTEEPRPSATSDLAVGGVPTPEQVSIQPSADGTAVTFTWDNPDPQDGDRYVWQRVGGAEQGAKTPTDSESVTITGVEPGSEQCISVEINRNGKLSTDPLRMCTQ